VSGEVLATVLAISAGLAGSVQVVLMSRLGERIGVLQALGFSSLLTAMLAFAVLLVARRTGQLVMGAAIDRWGLFGSERIALRWPRLLGIALLAVGSALSLKK
jgi:uncharacterized membrane protein YdcZ (DUF606 family)